MTRLSRREFIRLAAMGAGGAVLSYGLMGCDIIDNDNDDPVAVRFEHGVASGDPLADRVILWTRVTPQEEVDLVVVGWEVATDAAFTNLVITGVTTTSAERDYTVKVDAAGLSPNTRYYYRFKAGQATSTVARTQTLPVGDISEVKLAVISCSNYPAGYFNVLKEIGARDDLNAVLHLGDYIYEYPRGGYASADAAAMGREVLPPHELRSLEDYRTRYAQYHTDPDMQFFHSRLPIINVWDDHEIANDTWREGAEAHQDAQDGEFSARKAAAIQAYFEWLPIRPFSELDNETIYRTFRFGNLVDLHMLDTRVIGRDQQLLHMNYLDPQTQAFDAVQFQADLTADDRTMMGAEQFNWLNGELANDSGVWQVLGQQTLMGRVSLPSGLLLQLLGTRDPSVFANLLALMPLYLRAQANDPTLTPEELAELAKPESQATLALLQTPVVPYNLDSWDGYYYEREKLFAAARNYGSNLVVLAGDTHNAWASNLKDLAGNPIGVEFAGTSVSSPGMESEEYLNLAANPALVPAFEPGMVQLVEDLKYVNLLNRGYMAVTFTETEAKAEWNFVSTVKSKEYSMLADRAHTESVQLNSRQLTE